MDGQELDPMALSPLPHISLYVSYSLRVSQSILIKTLQAW